MNEENSMWDEKSGVVLWNGTYEKDFYWVYPPGNAPRVRCWPNAGMMHAVDGSGRVWKPEEQVGIRFVDDAPFSLLSSDPEGRTTPDEQQRGEAIEKQLASDVDLQRYDRRLRLKRERDRALGALIQQNEASMDAVGHLPVGALQAYAALGPPILLGPRERLEQRRQEALLQLGAAVHERAAAATVESKTRVLVEGKPWAKKASRGFKHGICKHKFGLAGGFAECSACGVKRDKACTHAFGFAGGFEACPMCGGG
jgi:hypothetical protein